MPKRVAGTSWETPREGGSEPGEGEGDNKEGEEGANLVMVSEVEEATGFREQEEAVGRLESEARGAGIGFNNYSLGCRDYVL